MNWCFRAKPWRVCGAVGLLSPAIMAVVELRFDNSACACAENPALRVAATLRGVIPSLT